MKLGKYRALHKKLSIIVVVTTINIFVLKQPLNDKPQSNFALLFEDPTFLEHHFSLQRVQDFNTVSHVRCYFLSLCCEPEEKFQRVLSPDKKGDIGYGVTGWISQIFQCLGQILGYQVISFGAALAAVGTSLEKCELLLDSFCVCADGQFLLFVVTVFYGIIQRSKVEWGLFLEGILCKNPE